MSRSNPGRTYDWISTMVVLLVVLAVGSRLIFLSQQHHAAMARETAASVAATFVKKIEPPLQRLAALAARQATAAQIDSLSAHTFFMSTDDTVLKARTQDAANAAGLASEWHAAESTRAIAGAAVLGPVRLGSGWLIAIRTPTVLTTAGAESANAWSVAYADLDELIAETHLARLVDLGYDFELSQVEPRSARSPTFVSSSNDLLTDSVSAHILLPAPAAITGSYLQVAIRPRAGWYPATLLESDIGLLAFMAWLLAFGVHDLSHALQRSRDTLAATRLRLRAVNQQLAGEMQLRLTLQETFDHARFHDAFTGLPNRRYFMDQLDRALREVRTKRRQRIAVIILDIARFKLVNDTLGHTAADELMVQAARRFEATTSAYEGVLARWSGDQFAVLILDPISTAAAMEIADLLQQDLRLPIELRRHRLVVSATVGVTCVDSGQQRAEDVVREADIALSFASRPETAKIVLYSVNMAGQAANLVSLEADLHVALLNRELRLLFQPIVDLRSHRMVGAEALLRWLHPVEAMLTPDRFLRIAEEAGLMVPITRWIILRVAKLAAEWMRLLPASQRFFVSINLSPTALRDPGLSEFIVSVLREHKLPPSFLKFELTEAALIGNVGQARETLDQLHGIGVQLMLDDFGTGYSSLSYLQLFPFDYVKIDRPFVNRSSADRANTGMMAAMVQMAASLNLKAIAEIIETEAAAAVLQEMGCDYGQGNYFSEPIEAERALQWLRSQDPFAPHGDGGTVVVPTLDEENSPTIIVQRTGLPYQLLQSTSDTVQIRPLDLRDDDDDSPTIMIPTESLHFIPDDEKS